MKRLLPLLPLLLLALSCGPDSRCFVPIGPANFSIEPLSAAHYGLNHVGGYEYLTGGHRGIVVIRTGYEDYVAYERTCPLDSTEAVSISEEWGEAVLECPHCHSLFSVYGDGAPMTGSLTPCNLFKYGTTFDGRTLWVY